MKKPLILKYKNGEKNKTRANELIKVQCRRDKRERNEDHLKRLFVVGNELIENSMCGVD